MQNTLEMKQTLASVSGITVLKSPYYAEGVQINWDLVKPKDQRLVEVLFEFVFAPVVIDEFGNNHEDRRAFWKTHEPNLCEGDQKVLRENPLKWGRLGKTEYLNQYLGVAAPAITLDVYGQMDIYQKLKYLDAVRKAIIKKFTAQKK